MSSIRVAGILWVLLTVVGFSASAQHQAMQYFRQNDQRGINVFETKKDDTTSFNHLKVKVGGNFEQSYQMLRDKNTALSSTETGFTGDVNNLIPPVRIISMSWKIKTWRMGP